MARIREEPRCHKSQTKHYTPPLELLHKAGENKHPDTLWCAAVFAAKVTAQYLGKSLTSAQLRKITEVPERVQSQILASN